MAIKALSYFKNKFKSDYKITEEDYADWLDSFRHASVPVPLNDTSGLEALLAAYRKLADEVPASEVSGLASVITGYLTNYLTSSSAIAQAQVTGLVEALANAATIEDVTQILQDAMDEFNYQELFAQVTFTEVQDLITNSKLRPGVLYSITGCAEYLYSEGITLYLRAINSSTLSEDGIGGFYAINYSTGVKKWTEYDVSNQVQIGDLVDWGNHVWECTTATELKTKIVNDLTLNRTNFFKRNYSEVSNNLYKIEYDRIKYDINTDHIYYREDANGNKVVQGRGDVGNTSLKYFPFYKKMSNGDFVAKDNLVDSSINTIKLINSVGYFNGNKLKNGTAISNTNANAPINTNISGNIFNSGSFVFDRIDPYNTHEDNIYDSELVEATIQIRDESKIEIYRSKISQLYFYADMLSGNVITKFELHIHDSIVKRMDYSENLESSIYIDSSNIDNLTCKGNPYIDLVFFLCLIRGAEYQGVISEVFDGYTYFGPETVGDMKIEGILESKSITLTFDLNTGSNWFGNIDIFYGAKQGDIVVIESMKDDVDIMWPMVGKVPYDDAIEWGVGDPGYIADLNSGPYTMKCVILK